MHAANENSFICWRSFGQPRFPERRRPPSHCGLRLANVRASNREPERILGSISLIGSSTQCRFDASFQRLKAV
jgi:hypothetical protein